MNCKSFLKLVLNLNEMPIRAKFPFLFNIDEIAN